ncbi:hypothetical protein EVJ58_g6618 [Rhodofomes roseus]|uniref:Gelsolin-like domain-containing protein n=1 Tax=Rhodofomes roseus TaxID=34475 RepID=A0A4Y9Y6Z0_9APHY|nr:hypothetical protein EVJ58_g6618 [Rhodofomes roseus]
MDRPSSAARRRTLDLPSKPETGLAEWTSKIKELQRQVDEDEEVEHKRLEEEIRASRMARLRRSGQLGSVDLSKSDLPRVGSPPALESPLGRQQGQEDALRKLTGEARPPAAMAAKPSAPRSSMSLAEFMGGRATGPRLTRHAPQQDAHDPTQFEQRTLRGITAPHPVFGRNGVAMPGMVGKSRTPAPSTPEPDEREKLYANWQRPYERTIHSCMGYRRAAEQWLDIPTGSCLCWLAINDAGSGALCNLEGHIHPVIRIFVPDSAPFNLLPQSRSNLTDYHIITEGGHNSLGPQIPASPNASSAFLRAPPPKDPTPSISRLQGRGFVKSMIHATAQLEATQPPSSPPLPEKKNSGGRKSAPVLDRWQSVATASSTPSPPPIIQPKAAAMRKSWTVDPSVTPDTTPPRSVKTDYTGRSLKSVSSVPSFHHSDAASSSAKSDAGDGSPRGRGLGSSTTMISYIKPIKTGDRPQTASPPPPEVIDEMGMRLTKDRAKKPRKARFAQDPVKETHVLSRATPAEAKQTSKSAPAPLSDLVSTVPAPEVVVSLPPPPDATPSQQEYKPVSPVKNEFDDDFVPAAAPPLVHKPSQLSHLVMPKSPVVPTQPIASPVTPNRGLTPSPTSKPAKEKPPASPARHTRIPSTGNRATVMDVAQALAAQTAAAEQKPQEDQVPEEPSPPDVKSVTANWAPRNGAARPDNDKRMSSYERYSAIVMPPVEEEKTPAPSPAGTLARSSALVFPDAIAEVELEVTPAAVERPAEPSTASAEAVAEQPATAATESKVIRIEYVDEPLPNVDVVTLLNSGCSPYAPDADVQTISVDVMTIIGNGATAVRRDAHIFYDHDVLAIIHRAKVRSAGLASTKVWGWKGKHSRLGEREEQKLQGLARQYGTKLIMAQQYCEPAELVAILGGKLAIRQGSRSHWSPENTAMHLVRSLNGITFIDEVDIGIRNLCSAFSYCLSLLGSVYIWYGCGSVDSERAAAREYAEALASSPSGVIELVEGESDVDEEMFWMILGDGDYAKADYWKWKASSPSIHPRVWSVDATKGAEAIQPVPAFADHPEFHHLVHLVDCVWEFFIVVGSEARGKRSDIRLALAIAAKLSDMTAPSRPFAPAVHALILPSQLPTDLRLHFRDLNEDAVNAGQIPDHMNLLAAGDAEEHLNTTTWGRAVARDPSMLPLGVQVSDLK